MEMNEKQISFWLRHNTLDQTIVCDKGGVKPSTAANPNVKE